MRAAAVDCGTNSIRLLVSDVEGQTQHDLLRRNEIVRLGQGVDRTGLLSTEALARTRAALESYAADLARLDVSRVRMVATSATRDAGNRGDFVAMVRQTLGVDPEVVTGQEEAALSFAGATRALPGGRAMLVCDIGGGSTELVRGTAAAEAALSVDVGCVRLAERHLTSAPPSAEALAALTAEARAAAAALVEAVPVAGAARLVCLAGTATTVAALALGLAAYDAGRIHLAEISLADVAGVAERLTRATRAEIAALPAMHPGRVDVIAAGAVVLREVVGAVGLGGCTVSESDILDGILWSVVDPSVGRPA